MEGLLWRLSMLWLKSVQLSLRRSSFRIWWAGEIYWWAWTWLGCCVSEGETPREQQPSLCSSCQRPSGLLYTCWIVSSTSGWFIIVVMKLVRKTNWEEERFALAQGFGDFSHCLADSILFRQLASQKHCRRRVWQKLLIASRKQG